LAIVGAGEQKDEGEGGRGGGSIVATNASKEVKEERCCRRCWAEL
jgi:hypothetical protein